MNQAQQPKPDRSTALFCLYEGLRDHQNAKDNAVVNIDLNSQTATLSFVFNGIRYTLNAQDLKAEFDPSAPPVNCPYCNKPRQLDESGTKAVCAFCGKSTDAYLL